MNKFQRSLLTLDLAANVVHIGALSIYKIIFFSETTQLIKLKFHMKTTYNKILYNVLLSHDQDGYHAHI